MLPHAAAAPSVRLHLPCVCTLPVLRGRPSISSAKPAECSGSGSSQTFSARQRQRRRQAAGWRRGHQREAETPQHRSLSETRYAAGPGSETTQRPEGKGGPPQSSLRTQAGPTIDETYRGGPSGETKSPAYRDYPTSRSTKAQRPSGPRIQPTETRQVSEDLQARNAQLSEELRSLRAVQGREEPQAALMAEAASAAAAAALAATAAEEAIQYAGTLQDALTDVRTAYLKNRATRSKTRPTEMPL